MPVKRKFFLLVVLLTALVIQSNAQDNLDLSQLMPKEVKASQLFVSDSFYTWCSSVIKGEDNRFHLFYSRWPHGKRALTDDPKNYILE